MSRLAVLAGVAVLVGASASALTFTPAQAQPGRGAPTLATPDFITAAAQTDEFERQEGRLAASRARNPHIKAFGQMMVRDHAKTTAGLKRAIRMDHMPPPPPPALTGDQQGKLDMLRSMRGRDFDRTYIDQQVEAHRMALGVMQAYANGGPGDRPIRKAAAETVPVVQHHLMMAEQLKASR